MGRATRLTSAGQRTYGRDDGNGLPVCSRCSRGLHDDHTREVWTLRGALPGAVCGGVEVPRWVGEWGWDWWRWERPRRPAEMVLVTRKQWAMRPLDESGRVPPRGEGVRGRWSKGGDKRWVPANPSSYMLHRTTRLAACLPASRVCLAVQPLGLVQRCSGAAVPT